MQPQINTCSIADCARPVIARGWCTLHYQRWKAHGDAAYQPPEKPNSCLVEGCGRPVRSNGLCSPHYARLRTHGELDPPIRIEGSLAQRFWRKVDPCRTDGCFHWLAARNKKGYGIIGTGTGNTSMLAHSVLRGKAPAGLMWDHLCRVRHCVNPDHLEAVTNEENQRRGLHGVLRHQAAPSGDGPPAGP